MIIDLSFHKALSGRRDKGNKNNKADTPSGVTYEQFMAMSEDDKNNIILDIVNNPNIVVPDYLDKSATSKVMYALGMNNKPEVVSDSKLDKIKGESLYRTVSDAETISAVDILEQIRYGDYTRLSGDYTSLYGRAIYFATDFKNSAAYGESTARMARAKLNPNAKIVSDSDLQKMVGKNVFFQNTPGLDDDATSLTALVNGIDGWRITPHVGIKNDYVMIINRKALTFSSTSKIIDSKKSWRKCTNAN